jgi:hypothetical protein
MDTSSFQNSDTIGLFSKLFADGLLGEGDSPLETLRERFRGIRARIFHACRVDFEAILQGRGYANNQGLEGGGIFPVG